MRLRRMGEDHPGLYRKGLFMPSSEVHWIRPDLKLEEGASQLPGTYLAIANRWKHAPHQRSEGLYIIL